MEIMLRGSGDIVFEDIICDKNSTELVGSGDIRINHLDVQASTAVLVGSGDINISQVNVFDTDLLLRGSGDIVVNFMEGCKSAEVKLSGSGDITLKGTLTHYDSHKNVMALLIPNDYQSDGITFVTEDKDYQQIAVVVSSRNNPDMSIVNAENKITWHCFVP